MYTLTLTTPMLTIDTRESDDGMVRVVMKTADVVASAGSAKWRGAWLDARQMLLDSLVGREDDDSYTGTVLQDLHEAGRIVVPWLGRNG